MMEFCRFRDFAIPLLGLSPRHPSIHEMRATRLVDSSFRAPHLPDAAGTRFCLGPTILRPIRDRFARPLRRFQGPSANWRSPSLGNQQDTGAEMYNGPSLLVADGVHQLITIFSGQRDTCDSLKFRGNPVVCAQGSAVLDIISRVSGCSISLPKKRSSVQSVPEPNTRRCNCPAVIRAGRDTARSRSSERISFRQEKRKGLGEAIDHNPAKESGITTDTSSKLKAAT
jgi:hypothetical protein